MDFLRAFQVDLNQDLNIKNGMKINLSKVGFKKQKHCFELRKIRD